MLQILDFCCCKSWIFVVANLGFFVCWCLHSKEIRYFFLNIVFIEIIYRSTKLYSSEQKFKIDFKVFLKVLIVIIKSVIFVQGIEEGNDNRVAGDIYLILDSEDSGYRYTE